ncbi:MAG: type II toxin-antitoxin system PemK/MazF family toxin [Synergistales bacterium]|nr:type II toxin-antitoxin system PemK/MazF family toxin [Synergistales bacterium]
MSTYKTGEIYLVDYPYEDKSVSKKRPGIILTEKQMAMYVTSQGTERPYKVKLEDWIKENLRRPSWAKIDRVVPPEEYKLITKIGELTDKDLKMVTELYQEFSTGKRHEFSLAAIINTDSLFLQKYDERWSCWLFPYFRTTEDNQKTADEFISDIIGSSVSADFVTNAIHCKYSVSDKVHKIYSHNLYKYKLNSIPEHMKEKEFKINGTKYRWMSFSEMESDNEIIEKNEEVIAFVKKNCKQ